MASARTRPEWKEKATSFGLEMLMTEMRGTRVTIELRSDATLVGDIEESDNQLNTTLAQVQGPTLQTFDRLYLRGRQIRFVHIPDHVDVLRIMQLRRLRGTRAKDTFRTHKRRDKKREQRDALRAHGEEPLPSLEPVVAESQGGVVLESDDAGR